MPGVPTIIVVEDHPVTLAVLMELLDAVYRSAEQGKEVKLG